MPDHPDPRVRLRRQKVDHLRSLQYTAEEIVLGLKEDFAEINLPIVYRDIRAIKQKHQMFIAVEWTVD